MSCPAYKHYWRGKVTGCGQCEEHRLYGTSVILLFRCADVGVWMTNLSCSAERVMRLDCCRRQIALRCKAWKSYHRLNGFVTGQKAIAEGVVWANLLSRVLKR